MCKQASKLMLEVPFICSYINLDKREGVDNYAKLYLTLFLVLKGANWPSVPLQNKAEIIIFETMSKFLKSAAMVYSDFNHFSFSISYKLSIDKCKEEICSHTKSDWWIVFPANSYCYVRSHIEVN